MPLYIETYKYKYKYINIYINHSEIIKGETFFACIKLHEGLFKKNTKACLFLIINPSPYENTQNEEIMAGVAKNAKWNNGPALKNSC